MPISRTPFLPDQLSDQAIPHGRLAYLQERARNLLFEFVLKKFLAAEKKGLTKAKLARRIHHRPEVITRLLGSPGNWTIATISDLLVGICGEELVPASSPLLGRAPRNDTRPDWLNRSIEFRAEKPTDTSTIMVRMPIPKKPSVEIF